MALPLLLSTKLFFPPASPRLVARPRLVEKVCAGLQARLLLVSAPAGLVICLVIVGAMMILNKSWTGNWPITLLALILGSLFLVLVGLAMGGFFKTIAQVNTWSGIFLVVLLLPSWVTVMPLPDPFGMIIRLVPSYYLVDLLNQSMAGNATFGSVWSSLIALAVCSVIAFSVVVWTVKRKDRI